MAHSLILGMTATGKTTLAYKLANRYVERGIPVVVLDVFCSDKWQADFITESPDVFMNVVKSNTGCAVFIDESGEKIGRYAKEMMWLGTASRHWGHNSHFICQRATMLDRNIRDMCLNTFVFRLPPKECKTIAEDMGIPEFLECSKLPQGEYIYRLGFNGQVQKANAFTQ